MTVIECDECGRYFPEDEIEKVYTDYIDGATCSNYCKICHLLLSEIE